jgi:hypothetical protein
LASVTRFQTRKAKLGLRRRKIIAARSGKLEKCGSHHGADRMTAQALSTGVAATVPVKTRHRLDRADFKRLAEYIAGGLPSTFSTSSVISQHLLALSKTRLPHLGF